MFKAICSSLFPRRTSSLPAKPNLVHKIQCPHHPKLHITHFCLKDNCSTPFTCSACRETHPKNHSGSFITVNQFYNDQFISNYAKDLNSKFSLDHIEGTHRDIIGILNKLEDEVMRSIRELKQNADDYFSSLTTNVERLRKAYTEFKELSTFSSSRSEIEADQVKQLIDDYKILKREIKVFDLSLEAIPSSLQREAEAASNKFKFEILSNLKTSLNLKPLDFFKLKVNSTYSVPASEGVLYEACAFIPKWKLLAVGFRKNQQGSLGLYDMNSHELVSTVSNVHKRWINHVIWIEKRNIIVTCSNDMKIKVFSVRDQGRDLKEVVTLRGHTNLVRCIKYLEHDDMLASAGDDPDIKLWNLQTLKRAATISTNCNTNMDGSIAYIPKEKLIGVGFRSGHIRFYHIYKRNMVFELQTGFENFYTYALQYLPKRKLILGRVKEHVIKVWKYDEEKKKAEPYKTINAKGSYPDCIVPNEDEGQLLFTSRDQFLESYDFGTDKTSIVNLNPHIKKTNALVFLENLGKVSVCDYTSGKVCILN